MYKQNTGLHTCPFQNQLAPVPKPAPPQLPSHLSGAAQVTASRGFCLPEPSPGSSHISDLLWSCSCGLAWRLSKPNASFLSKSA